MAASIDFEPVTGPYAWLGWILIAAALAIPLLAVLSGKMDPASAGDYTARGIGSLLGLAFIGWLITRKRGPKARANARIAIGFVLISVVMSNVAGAAHEREEMKAFVSYALKMQAQHTLQVAELNAKFEKLPLDQVLATEHITSPSGIMASQRIVAQLRALVAERDVQLSKYLSDVQDYIAHLKSESGKRGALESFNETVVTTKAMYANLAQVQLASADAMDAILKWCAIQGKTIEHKDGQLLFTSTAQQAQLQALVTKLSEAEAAEAAVIKDVQAWQVGALKKLEENKAAANRYLSN
ncbi:hypothetical protein ACFSQU_17955 [Massilia sp. GCM10020059]|uniref:Uncharacterized protein n=1 Tax=Massilia agrisoli TaxID=2892444 RepID=A0ABS8IU68_9BURK|nr:hypothetical protein [Massilia agrisoli]MCC6071426.1 hypothetical protein [Massilia agrisoli]